MERLSLVDFEGHIATTLFTRGCNFCCPYCHNSELALARPMEPISFTDIMSYLKKREGIIDAVCISGGEPTINPELKEALRELRALKLLIKLDTNGSNPEILRELIDEGLIDYVAMDIKNGLSGYNRIIGKPHAPINELIKSINILRNSKVGYEFRTTLVKEFHSRADIEEIGILLKGEERLYLQKFTDHGFCIENHLHEVDKKKALEYQDLLSKYIKNVYLRGY